MSLDQASTHLVQSAHHALYSLAYEAVKTVHPMVESNHGLWTSWQDTQSPWVEKQPEPTPVPSDEIGETRPELLDPEERDFLVAVTEDMNKCTVEAFPNYNPYIFDDYCAQFDVCLKFWYQDTCLPENAIGMSYMQVRAVNAILVGVPFIIFWTLAGLIGGPLYACYYITDGNIHQCTFNLFANSFNSANSV